MSYRIASRSMLFAAVASAFLFGTAPVTLAATPLPTCRYADVGTRFTSYSLWPKTFLDTIYKVPSTYSPPNRVSTAEAGLNGAKYVRDFVIPSLKKMAAAAKAAGAPFEVQSAYRSYQTQQSVFAAEVERYGYETALKQSARPGHSEHQLGTTLDFRTPGGAPPWEYADWGTTRAGKWLAANSWRYGFVMSYPKGKTSVTCYSYEPWHYRYVGLYLAPKIRESGLTTREFLWYRYESVY